MSLPDVEKKSPHDTSNRDEPTATESVSTNKELDVESQPLATEPTKEQGPSPLRRSHSDITESSGDAAAVAEGAKSTPEKKNWYRRLTLFKGSNPPPVPEERGVSREYTAGFFSHLTLQWMAPLMSVGYQRPLELNDIWLVNPNRGVDVLAEKLEASFKRRVANGDKRPLVWALYDTLKFELILGGLCQLFASILQSFSPFVLRYLIAFAGEAYIARYTGHPAPSIGRGVGLVLGVTFMQVFQSLATNHFIYRGMVVGGQARAILIAAIFDKAMKISGRAKAGGLAVEPAVPPPEIKPGSDEEKKWYKKILKKRQKEAKTKGGPQGNGIAGDGEGWGNGRIINLMSTDTYRVDTACGMGHMVWTAPISIIITIVLLLVNLTYSALAGIGLLVLLMPILGKVVRTLFVRRVAINKITDERVSLTQEILQAVRFVKYFGWEPSFLTRLGEIRSREIRGIQVLLAMRSAIMAVGLSLPNFASMLAFITYSLSNHSLNPARVFSSLALFNGLRLPLNFLPMIIGQVTDALSSLDRIQEFLLAEEAEDTVTWDLTNQNAIIVKNANFTWERSPTQDVDETGGKKAGKGAKGKAAGTKQKKEKRGSKAEMAPTGSSPMSPTNGAAAETIPYSIQGIDFTVGRNELIAVIGTVGCGKSSLLAALAGDMRRTNGEIVMGASRAFCPQYAWIQNASVRDNIVFGKKYDPEWYNKVVDACALRADLEMLPAGDKTEIGERGITVSGGQKQRLNIARAIYFNSEIILMDDPLSAVDAHVGRHIMDNAICGLLKDKCRILATHQLHVLNRCDRIIWMQDGRIGTIDTFDNLMANNSDFVKLMATTAVKEEEKKEHHSEEEDEEVPEESRLELKRSASKKPAAALMQSEERAVKSVSWGVYLAYLRASGSVLSAPIILLLLILSQGANIVAGLWLSWWTSNKFGFSEGTYIGVYAGLGVSQTLLMFMFSFIVSVLGTQAGKVMLHRALSRVLRAPMSFFDTTPLGRITNRFSKDIDVMDNTLTESIRMYFMTMAMIISVFILIIVYFHYFAIALGPLFVLFLLAANYYRASAREVKRFEAVLRSGVFARFSEAVHGTSTIRAYGLQSQFSRSIRGSIDDMDSAYFLTFANQRWLSMRLDVIGSLLVFTTGILVVTSRFNVPPSIGGLVLSYILSIVQMIQFTVRQLAEVENNMNATERIHYYGTQLEQEAPSHLGEVNPAWPERGEIIFDNVQMRYREGLPLVLHGLSMHVKAGERIGVVGRTGAGKSSIMSALFRLIELSGGSITIDGVNISQIGLHDLRSRLAIIPQDPALFRGTIRSNLDPFNEHTDLELWSALRQAHLVHDEDNVNTTGNEETEARGEIAKTNRIQLDSVVEEEGLNYSLGQRQLLALARALVRGSQIIVCDEATSSVDMDTDQKIQQTILDGFRGKTLLCIAHRLKTIIGYDRICVMDKGSIIELDTPLALWERGGVFRGMCDRSGIRREDFGLTMVP